jgi:hypothetical protein
MTNQSTPPPPISFPIVDANGKPTKEMADFIHRLWAQVQDLQKRITVLEGP